MVTHTERKPEDDFRSAGDQARLQGQIGAATTMATAFATASGISPNSIAPSIY